jgi:RNA polymerase sigma-70 factor (ECF subfamily)
MKLRGLTSRERAMTLPSASSFEQVVLPHLDAAYNLARWLTRNEHDAADVVQEAYLRALRFFDSYHGGDGRAWLLTIVRNTCHTHSRASTRGIAGKAVEFDEQAHALDATAAPDAEAMRDVDQQAVKNSLAELPVELREMIVLRELEGLAYKEIAAVTGLPIGTVMSRLSRAREKLRRAMDHEPADSVALKIVR